MAKESISWSASADKSWVTLIPSSGFGDSNIKVTVEPAKTESDDLTATISIRYGNGDSYTKTISRCERKAVSSSYSLSFTVSGTYDSCFEGNAQLNDIKGTTITTLDNGTQTSATTELSINDIKVSYVINGVSYPSIQKNMTTIPRTVKVVGVWNDDAVYEATIMQSAMSVTSSGYAETSTSYTNLYFPSSNPNLASSCSAGTATFSLRADKIVRNSTITAQTSCGDKITIDGSSQESITRDTDVSNIADFSLCSTSQSSLGSFNGNVLSYNSNETDGNVALRICGKIGSNTVSTTYTIPKGSCGKVYYVHIFFDKDSVPYKGTASEMTAQLTYFASLSDDPTDISTAITDGVKLLKESGDRFTIGEPVVEDYVIHRNVLFNTYMEEMGTNYTFTATYEGVSATTRIYQSSQYENVIPAADYFVFTYEWDYASTMFDDNMADGGVDLDSLTTISSPVMSQLSNKYVGWNALRYVGTLANPYLKWGGDNQNSGDEGAIVNFKSMVQNLTIGYEDTIQCDIYANWYRRRDGGNMRIKCVAYKGQENGTFADEIQQSGFIFLPIEGKCTKVWENSFPINVLASGKLNGGVASLGCVDSTYSLVATLRHNVGTQSTSLIMRQGVDHGYNGGSNQIGYKKNIPAAGLTMETADGINFDKVYSGTVSSAHKIEWKNIKTTYINQNTNEKINVEMFNNSKDKLILNLYAQPPVGKYTKITSVKITPNVTYTKDDIEGGWIDRLIVTTNSDGTFDIFMSLLANSESGAYSHEFYFNFTKYNAYPPCANKGLEYIIEYVQP